MTENMILRIHNMYASTSYKRWLLPPEKSYPHYGYYFSVTMGTCRDMSRRKDNRSHKLQMFE